MKNVRFSWFIRTHSILGFTLGMTSAGLAQTSGVSNSLIPVVTIRATDPIASWSGDTGTFTVFRSGPTNLFLNVFYGIGGTASNGVDYATIGHWVSIRQGERTNTITIKPINNGQTITEAVVLTLEPSPAVGPVNYSIGCPSNATVYISPHTNIPPSVTMVSPTNGSVFYTPVNISLFARASDPDGTVANVEFFAGTTDLGSGHQVVLDPPGVNGVVGPVYFLIYSNVPPGSAALTAVATDNLGASTTSAAVNISVLPGPPPPPPTNLPPVVRITSPPNGAVFHAPVDVPIYAYARDPDDAVATVEFFADATSLGFGHRLFTGAVPSPTATGSNIFLLVWSNAPVSTPALTAQATDTRGASTVSDPVKITILPSPPPPTNRPPIVNIVASDPVAVEGTNCWPWIAPTNPTPLWSNWPVSATACRYFTNCGPKNATFIVHRIGATNDPLTVNYAIGGTASNGVDYVTLSGNVTIPVGERGAAITVVPIDDGPPDITSTVVLKLVPDPNYLIGLPASAAAIILDGIRPRPVVTGALPDRCFHVNATGPDGAWFHIEYTTDLRNWISICTNQVVQGSIDFVDPDAPGDSHRFYRAVPENNPPPE